MNTLQKLIHLRGLTVHQLAAKIGRGYHSVQKVVKGHRPVQYIRKEIAEHLGLDPQQVWGVNSNRYLSSQIQQEIDRRAAVELRRLKERYLGNGDAAAKAA